MTPTWTRWSSRAGLLAALAVLLLALSPFTAQAGVATYGAVLLDPYDITPGIGFDHYRYGCNEGCGDGCHYGCGRHHLRCDDGCGRARRARCDDGCGRPRCEDRCGEARCTERCGERDCADRCRDAGCGDRCGGRDVRHADFVPCTQGHCSDVEHWEHRWRNGDRAGEEWYDRGRREHTIPDGQPEGDGHDRDGHDGDGPRH